MKVGGQAGLLLCLAWGPCRVPRSPQPRVTGPGAREGPGVGPCAVQALCPCTSGHRVCSCVRAVAHAGSLPLVLPSAAVHVRTRLAPPVPGEPRRNARGLQPNRAPTLSAAPAGAPEGARLSADLEPAWQGGSWARRVLWAEREGPGQESCKNAGPAAREDGTPRGLVSAPAAGADPVPVASVAATQYEDPTPGGHWAARVKCCREQVPARSSQPVTPLRTNPSACFTS